MLINVADPCTYDCALWSIIKQGARLGSYLRHNDRFYFMHNMFIVAMGLALMDVVADPHPRRRRRSSTGWSEPIACYIDHVEHDSGLVALFCNPYAAVPCVRVAFAVIVSVQALLHHPPDRVAKVLSALYPLLVTFVVLM